jgi:hypothetical protein
MLKSSGNPLALAGGYFIIMAVVYYPKDSVILKRDTNSSSFEQIVLNSQPNTILYFGTDSELSAFSASTVFITSSCSVSSSYVEGYIPKSQAIAFAIVL